MKSITITPESFRTSTITPIILSERERVQVSFEGKQVDNYNDLNKNIKGTLIIKKKTKKIESFEDVEKFGRKDVSSNELIEIALDTEETYNLAKGLYSYYLLLNGKQTNPFSEITYVERDQRLEQIKSLIDNREDLLEVLATLDLNDINVALNLENLRRAKEQIENNLENDSERDYWQKFFEDNAWILAQLFHAPVMLFDGKKYLGGKSLDDNGGQYSDFIYKNSITNNVSIIEIKSPKKPLIGKPYRQVHTISDEVSGGVNQLIKQKETLLNNYSQLYMNADKNGEKFNANNIDCILVVGNVGLLEPDKREVFDSYRNELRSISIIGFDELLLKIDNMLNILEQA
ncbi:MAG: DUF4263 domain-containing protein [Clostridiales bacterium]|nr:DUF4263 domain-containing protein [Candidatus Crickella equi]